MKIDKKIPSIVRGHKIDGEYLGKMSFVCYSSLAEIKSHARSVFSGHGKVSISVSQDGGYYRSFDIITYK